MAYTAYDWQQTLAEKADYAESRLRHGSPVVALSYDEGILLLTVRRSQPKIYEIYDRLALGALGNPSDLEVIRQFAVDFSHAEGFQRSAEDVSIQRVVGFAISPMFKRSFSDPRRMPLVLRSLFAQVGQTPEEDQLLVLGYDGEFHRKEKIALIAGTNVAEARMQEALKEADIDHLKSAVKWALYAWSVGQWQPEEDENGDQKNEDKDAESSLSLPSEKEGKAVLEEFLEVGDKIEAAILQRSTQREQRYQTLDASVLAPFLPKEKANDPA